MRNLNGVKAGDKVTVRWSGIERFLRVVEVGKLKIKTDDGRMWKRSGYQWGGSPYCGPWISLYEDADAAELREQALQIRRKNLACRLRDANWLDMPLETLVAVHALVFPKFDGGGQG